MKILQLTCHFSPNVGGVETHLDDLVAVLGQKGYEIFVLTYRPLTTKTSWKMYEKKKNLQILRVPWFPGFFYELVSSPVFEFLYLLPGLFLATPFILFKENPDVIHAHGLVAGFVGVFWAKIFRKRIVLSLHSIYHFPKAGAYRSSVCLIFQQSDVVLCLSRQSAQEVQSLGIPEKKIRVFTYWIDLQRFLPIKNAKRILGFTKKFVVLFVGRLVKEKGVNELLSAAKGWSEKILIVIVGTGPLEELVKGNADGKRIIYAGKISQDKLPLYYSASDALIVPSIHEEGFGRVILEALSCGTPVIAAKRGGILEAIDKNVGYLIDITSENIKKVVEYCFTNKIELEQKSKKTRLFVNKKYSQKNAEVILASYT